MCGIFGVWHLKGKSVDRDALRLATNLMRHRGPDDEGYLLIDVSSGNVVPCKGRDTVVGLDLPALEQASPDARGSLNMALGFRRLAILDTSPSGHQPMRSHDGRFWIVHNGEIYNYLELRDELKRIGHTFQTRTDTEVLLAAYEQWGPDCLNRFNGMWAFAIWDCLEKKLFLARDRFGVKPLYYASGNGQFTFASEIKALVGRHGLPFEPGGREIYRYVCTGQMPESRQGATFFSNVRSVPPGHFMFVQTDGSVRSERYWSLPADTVSSTEADTKTLINGYQDLFLDAIRLRLRSDVPVGSCLSGGVDSSSIVCSISHLLQMDEGVKQIGDRQKTFTAVYGEPGPFDERPYAESVVAATGAEGNYVVPTVDRLLADLGRLAWHQDEPFQSTSMFAQWCVMDRVRERGVTVLLDGQGADEVLAGYRPFLPFLADLLRQRRFSEAVAEARSIQSLVAKPWWRLLARALFEHFPAPWVRGWQRMRTVHPGELCALNPDFSRQYGDARPSSANLLPQTDLQQFLRDQIEETSLPHLLRYEDRNSMAFSVESRLPFLDYRLVEYSLRKAAQLCIRQGWTKWILRMAMQSYVPRDVIWRKDKIGFETPEAAWMAVICRSLGGALGRGTPLADYLDVDRVRSRLAGWPQADTPREDLWAIWRCFSLDGWLRAFSSSGSGV